MARKTNTANTRYPMWNTFSACGELPIRAHEQAVLTALHDCCKAGLFGSTTQQDIRQSRVACIN